MISPSSIALCNISLTGCIPFKLLHKIQILIYFQKFLYFHTSTINYLLVAYEIELLVVVQFSSSSSVVQLLVGQFWLAILQLLNS